MSDWAKCWVLILVNDSMSSIGSHERKVRYENSHSETYDCRVRNRKVDNEQRIVV